MFLQVDVIEFINKIINQSNINEKEIVKSNITKFREYLRLTGMTDEATLEEIDIILDCLDELMILKSKLGDVDVMMMFESREKDKPRKLSKTRQSMYDDKHYRHYQRDTSSNCGSSISYSSSCGTSSTYRRC